MLTGRVRTAPNAVRLVWNVFCIQVCAQIVTVADNVCFSSVRRVQSVRLDAWGVRPSQRIRLALGHIHVASSRSLGTGEDSFSHNAWCVHADGQRVHHLRLRHLSALAGEFLGF